MKHNNENPATPFDLMIRVLHARTVCMAQSIENLEDTMMLRGCASVLAFAHMLAASAKGYAELCELLENPIHIPALPDMERGFRLGKAIVFSGVTKYLWTMREPGTGHILPFASCTYEDLAITTQLCLQRQGYVLVSGGVQ